MEEYYQADRAAYPSRFGGMPPLPTDAEIRRANADARDEQQWSALGHAAVTGGWPTDKTLKFVPFNQIGLEDSH
jgi:hypothetical protein